MYSSLFEFSNDFFPIQNLNDSDSFLENPKNSTLTKNTGIRDNGTEKCTHNFILFRRITFKKIFF